MAKKLFVGNLSWDTTDSSLSDFFATIGTVSSAQVITDKYTGKARGFGFVEMENDADADKAMQELNGKELDGRAISVNEAREREQRDNRYQGGGSGGGSSYGGGGGGFRGNDRRGGGNDRGGRNRY